MERLSRKWFYLPKCHLVKGSGDVEEGWGRRPGNRKEMHHSCQVIVLLTHGGQFKNIMLVLFQIIDVILDDCIF